ncbi:17-beta-hydroxysteroid dehydrogenase 14 isoform X1 [Alligator sinensis]|uniref:17-beta-hydroxysteroid dehydrogenase 14 isoform X1 n=1 Tax=Alligator sinensis TaxID=38654 RepID=A0A1U7R044_ALLSI|nr:17-beta-hydroxysteroid dehydrogenase 14 isoform X1 [Alligator sinensis]
MASGLRYPGKVALVTGGTRGIGEAIVREFVHQGAHVVFCAPKAEEEVGEALEQALKESGGPGKPFFWPCDVTSEQDIQALVSTTLQHFGHLDCLVNNAGQHPPEQEIDDISPQKFRELLEINLIGYFLMAKFALPHLRKTQGNIINISSLVGVFGQRQAVPYVATKGAVTAMTKAMAIDESRYGVRVNSISPGNIWTPMWAELARQTANPKAVIQAGKEAQLLARMGTPKECARAVLYLAADATFCTGIDLLLSGGAELGYAPKSQPAAS